MRIVIAEDETIIRTDLKEILNQSGNEVVGEARNGADALELVRSLKPDCVFMDVRMATEEDGLQAAETICAEQICAVVMLTAFAQDRIVQKAVDAGVMGYVTKPFSKRDILPALEVATSRFKTSQELIDEISQLEKKLEDRKIIDKAKGLLMQKGMSEEQAFQTLRKTAMNNRTSLKAVAQAIILSNQCAL
ncbi:MAG: ANTAR domain-containing response regulator [Anaerotardibacter sp.]